MAGPIKILIVDDSLTMRALFCGVFEGVKGLQVVDHVANADEARDAMISLKPDVVTLDIEMPGMSGLEYLEEVMRERPTPVIMLSTLTQKGATASLTALELGAVDCFPKPTHATIDEFKRIGPKLVALVKAAAAAGPSIRAKNSTASGPAAVLIDDSYMPDEKMIAISTSVGGVDALMQMIPSLPKNCPPTLVLVPLDDAVIDPFIKRLGEQSKATVVRAAHGDALEVGHVYIAADTANHVVVDSWPGGTIKLVPADPINGFRPSATLLYAALAKGAGPRAVGAILTGMGEDGITGLAAMRAAGASTYAQDPATATVAEAPAAAIAKKVVDGAVPLADMAHTLALKCLKTAGAA